MKSRKGQAVSGSTALIGAFLVGALLVTSGAVDIGQLTTTPGQQQRTTGACGFAESVAAGSDNCGDSSTVDVAAENEAGDNNRQRVSTDAYAVKAENGNDPSWTDLGSQVTTQTSRASFTNIAVGQKAKVIAFNGTYDYGFMKEVVVDDSGGESPSVKVLEGDATPGLIARDDASDINSLSLGTGQDDTFDSMRLKVNSSNQAYNLGMICYSSNNDTVVDDVQINDDRVSETTEPDRLNVDKCWSYDKRVGLNGKPSDVPQNFDELNIGPVTVKVADGQNPSGGTKITFRVADYAPFINQDKPVEEQFDIGVEDENDNDVGNNDQTDVITLN